MIKDWPLELVPCPSPGMLALLVPLVAYASFAGAASSTSVTIKNGTLNGYGLTGMKQELFLNVPYAATTGGKNVRAQSLGLPVQNLTIPLSSGSFLPSPLRHGCLLETRRLGEISALA